MLFLLLCSFSWLSEAAKKTSLIFAVYDAQVVGNHIVHLRKISFTDGVPGAVENIMDVTTQLAGDKVPRIRFDLGPNQIYRNRWLITSYGNVIDLQQKKVLLDGHDQFVRAGGDSLVFYTNDIIRGVYYSLLDLKTGTYVQIKKPGFKAITGKDVSPDCSTKNFRIFYYPPSAAKEELVRDAGYGEDISLISGARPQCPLFWIDNDNFIYPNYSATHNYVALMKVSVSSKTQEKIGDIDQLPENHELSHFYKNPEGEIVYACARGHFLVDVSKKKVSELSFLSAGNNFSVSVNEEKEKGRAVRNGEQVIGTYFCSPESVVSSKGYVAFPYEIVLGGEHYLQGAMIYSAAANKWKSVGDSDLDAVIGWMEE